MSPTPPPPPPARPGPPAAPRPRFTTFEKVLLGCGITAALAVGALIALVLVVGSTCMHFP